MMMTYFWIHNYCYIYIYKPELLIIISLYLFKLKDCRCISKSRDRKDGSLNHSSGPYISANHRHAQSKPVAEVRKHTVENNNAPSYQYRQAARDDRSNHPLIKHFINSSSQYKLMAPAKIAAAIASASLIDYFSIARK